ncbi:condensation domain-containing protein [Streptomyces polyrhachis]|uniref:Condensation domain-containing protein n=1 Tax=Streptomyces polyrhachis TaxID=1282885 RepID=A0ABW2GEN2_9ACTN
MRITDIQRCELRPGRLVEWSLSPATVARAARLPEDARRPAYVQESHIRTAKSVHEDGLTVPTWIGCAFDLPDGITLDALEGALAAWTLRHETLRSGFRWEGAAGNEMRRFTLDAADVALHRQEAGTFTDAAELTAHLQHRFDTAANALTWPNFLYAAVVRDDGTSVYAAFDHSNVDSYSIQRLPADLLALCTAPAAETPAEEAGAASYVDFCEIERSDADRIDGDHEIVARWREFIHRCDGRLPAFPVDLGLEADGALPRQQLLVEDLVGAEEAAAFEAHCRPYGGSLVGVLAATALIVHEIGDLDVYRTVVPFHTRVTSQWTQSVGWYVGGAPIEVPIDQAPDFPRALAAVRATLRANRRLARMPIARVLHLLGADFRPTSPDLYSIVSYVDARAIPGADRWAELRAYGLMRVSYGDQACVWINRLPEGLQLASRYPDTDVAGKNMRLYTERLRDLITSVARS